MIGMPDLAATPPSEGAPALAVAGDFELVSPASLCSGTTTFIPHLGQTAFLPARKAFTFSLWPFGQ